MASTYEPISTTTLGSNTATVTFSSIPSTYTDLVLVFAGTMTTTNLIVMQFNGDTGTNYSETTLQGNGTTASSQRHSSATYIYLTSTNVGTGQINGIIQVQNYSNTTTNKTALARINSASDVTAATVGLWRSTAAINSVSVISGSSFATGATFTLYGIKSF